MLKTIVSIVIPTKNGGSIFVEVLKGIQSQVCSEEIELLVIDSGSTDNTLENALNYGAKVYQIPPEEFNHGLTRNMGIEASKGEFVVLITQDAVPEGKKLLSNLIEPFKDPEVGGVYARQIPRTEADILTRRNLNGWLTNRTELDVKQINNWDIYKNLSSIEKYMFCNFDNVCSAIRRKTWETVPFHQNDFGEDIEWSKRALEAGWKIAYQPEAIVIHSHARSIKYEYKRTYICHRKLYELFGLQTVPTIKYVLRSILIGMVRDFIYTCKNESDFGRCIKLLARIPGLTLASVWGQYRGAYDQKSNCGKKVQGV